MEIYEFDVELTLFLRHLSIEVTRDSARPKHIILHTLVSS